MSVTDKTILYGCFFINAIFKAVMKQKYFNFFSELIWLSRFAKWTVIITKKKSYIFDLVKYINLIIIEHSKSCTQQTLLSNIENSTYLKPFAWISWLK